MKKIISVLLIAVALFGCGPKHEHPADIAATYIEPFDKSYQIAERSLLALHDFCVALGDSCSGKLRLVKDNWNKIDDINDKISVTVDKVHVLWLDVSKARTPENEQQLKEQLALLTTLLNDLLAFIPSDSQTGVPSFDQFYAQQYQDYIHQVNSIVEGYKK